ncbi:hypothetical protein LguiA_024187 [Lonicera macranthoides]
MRRSAMTRTSAHKNAVNNSLGKIKFFLQQTNLLHRRFAYNIKRLKFQSNYLQYDVYRPQKVFMKGY